MNTIFSPFIKDKKAVLIRKIRASKVIKSYNLYLKIDVKRFFKNTHFISLYECKDSGFQFYYPFNTDGDGKFYEDLSRFEWYYSSWKWEHEQVKKIIKPEFKILEVGCAKGAFLEKISNQLTQAPVGLELNENAVDEGMKKGLNIQNQTLSEHVLVNIGVYDLVCSFQVVEHISDVKGFLLDKVRALNKGGLLVFSVPNNDSFIKNDPFPILNMPPHHMGLWNKKSISFLEKVFPLKLVSLQEEPFDERQYNYYIKIKLTNLFQSQFLATLIMKLSLHKPFFNRSKIIKQLSSMSGHSILAIFEKTE
jgi:2-polyprenyl-3-methyl-5-hydroxy-6-metoxy-1,4-benzoquinol methylase